VQACAPAAAAHAPLVRIRARSIKISIKPSNSRSLIETRSNIHVSSAVVTGADIDERVIAIAIATSCMKNLSTCAITDNSGFSDHTSSSSRRVSTFAQPHPHSSQPFRAGAVRRRPTSCRQCSQRLPHMHTRSGSHKPTRTDMEIFSELRPYASSGRKPARLAATSSKEAA